MTTLLEGELEFKFDSDCDVGKYDEWSFYRRNSQSRESFQHAAGGSKAVDFVCVSQSVAWLIEVKNYRKSLFPIPSSLSDVVAQKVRDTLAGLATAATNADDVNEKKIAQSALSSGRRWRVVLHLEQPAQNSALRPTAIDPAALLQKLRQKLKFIDPGPQIVDVSRKCPGMKWTTTL
ncbi:MAG: hypothetical protein OXE44_07115 [Nitrospinae bacterium]|nr:hypothetical protein [Nitrospinota bacterium]